MGLSGPLGAAGGGTAAERAEAEFVRSLSDVRVRLGSGVVVERAALWRRIAARLLDMALLSPAMLWLVLVAYGRAFAGFLDPEPVEIPPWVVASELAAVGVLVLYEPVMVARWGATVGKLTAGIRVVGFADGKGISHGRSWARVSLPTAAAVSTFGVALFVLMEAVVFFVGVGWFAAMLVLAGSVASRPDGRGWHDRLAGTVVVAKSSAPSLRTGTAGRRRGRRARMGDGKGTPMDERWQRFMAESTDLRAARR